MEATEKLPPFPWDKETDMSVGGTGGILAALFGKIFSMFK